MNDQTGTITLRIVATDLASGNFSKAIAGMDAMAKKGGLVGSVFQGMGISFGMMLNPIGLVTQGIGLVTNTIGDMVAQAKEGEAATARLDAALKTNVAAWNGNDDAINKVIDSRIRLGFEDNQQQDALAGLVAHTHDVTKALDAERVAMDLARFKGVSLADASQLVGKAWDGNTTALKRMGIQLEKGAKGTAALAGIEKVAGGQAEAFAGTLAGKQASLSASIDKVEEGLGTMLLGPATDFLGFLADVISPAPKVRDALQMETDALKAQTDALIAHAKAAAGDAPVVDKVAQSWAEFALHGRQIATQFGKDAFDFTRDNEALAKAFGFTAEEVAQHYQVAAKAGETYDQIVQDLMYANIRALPAFKATSTAITDTSDAMVGLATHFGAGPSSPLFAAQLQIREVSAALAGMSEGIPGVDRTLMDLEKRMEATFKPSHFSAPVHAMAVQITGSFLDIIKGAQDLPTGIVAAINDGKDNVKQAMQQLMRDIKHPFRDENYVKWLGKQAAKATKAIHQAELTGDPAIVQEAVDTAAAVKQQYLDALHALQLAARMVQPGNRAYNRRLGYPGGSSSGGPNSLGGSSFVSGPSTGGGPGAGVNIHFNMLVPPGPAEAQRIGGIIGPIVARHLQSSGHL